MGSIHEPPLSKLALSLAKQSGLRYFVETGTYLGYSLPWASTHFQRVFTIEVRDDFHTIACRQCGHLTNVEFLLGNSASKLKEVCNQLDDAALFWLDAHAGAGYFGETDCCPLLEELKTIIAKPQEHVIFIDDARAFLAPPPPPFDYLAWPSLDEIMGVLAQKNLYVTIIGDTIIATPRSLREIVAHYCFDVRPTI